MWSKCHTFKHSQLEQLKQEMAQVEQSQTDHSQQEGSHDDINLQNLKYQLEEVIGGDDNKRWMVIQWLYQQMETQNENLTAALNDLNETHEVKM